MAKNLPHLTVSVLQITEYFWQTFISVEKTLNSTGNFDFSGYFAHAGLRLLRGKRIFEVKLLLRVSEVKIPASRGYNVNVAAVLQTISFG